MNSIIDPIRSNSISSIDRIIESPIASQQSQSQFQQPNSPIVGQKRKIMTTVSNITITNDTTGKQLIDI